MAMPSLHKRYGILAAAVALATACCLSVVIGGGVVMGMAAFRSAGPGQSPSDLGSKQQSARPSMAAIALSPTVANWTWPTQTPAATPAPVVVLEMSVTPTRSLPAATSPTVSLPTATAMPPRPTTTPASSPTIFMEHAAPSPGGGAISFPERPATRLVIPALGLDAPVTVCPIVGETWEVEHLGTDTVGHLEGTASPGDGNNVVLAAHVTVAHDVDGPFSGLGRLQPGDDIIVYDGDLSYTYIVDSRRLVERTDVQVAHPSDTGQVTLITCSNWSDELSRYQQRLIVVGHLVDEPESQD
jgi:sortase A